MPNFKNPQLTCSKALLRSLPIFLTLLIITLPSAVLADSHPCVNAIKHLRGDLNVVMNRGGFWTLMEQRGLKENSMIGMQADGKLARIVGAFETLCESKKKPTKQLFLDIQNLLGDARVMYNPRSTNEKIMKSINKLIKDLDTLLVKIE